MDGAIQGRLAAAKPGGELFCLHGMLGTPGDWEGVLPQPTAGWVRRDVDLLNLLEWGVSDLAEAGRALVASSPPGSWLCGYSLGGRIALHALLAAPEHWAGAILTGADVGLIDPTAKVRRGEQDLVWMRRFASGEDWGKLLADWDSQAVLDGELHPDVAEGWAGARARLEARRVGWARAFACWGLGRQRDLWWELDSIRVPVLWLAGARDEKFVEIGQRAVEILPQAQLRIFPGVGHRLPWQAPAEFAAAVEEWLKCHHPPRPNACS